MLCGLILCYLFRSCVSCCFYQSVPLIQPQQQLRIRLYIVVLHQHPEGIREKQYARFHPSLVLARFDFDRKFPAPLLLQRCLHFCFSSQLRQGHHLLGPILLSQMSEPMKQCCCLAFPILWIFYQSRLCHIKTTRLRLSQQRAGPNALPGRKQNLKKRTWGCFLYMYGV